MELEEKIKVFERHRMRTQKSISRVMRNYVEELPPFVKATFETKDNEIVIHLSFNRADMENFNIEDYEI